jgi:hypothetical protein
VDETLPTESESAPEAAAPVAPTHVWDDPADAESPAESLSIDRPTQMARPYARRPTAGWRLFSVLATLSLLACATAAVGWVRSYYTRDVTTFTDGGGQDHVLYSDRGHVEWIATAPGDDPGAGEPRGTRIPYWLPVGITALLPLAWLIRRRTRVASDLY